MLGDFDFNGTTDVAVVAAWPVSNGPVYDYWLQRADGQMAASAALDSVHLIAPTFDPQTKTISSSAKAGADQVMNRRFRWDAGHLQQVSCSVDTLDPAHVPPDRSLCNDPP